MRTSCPSIESISPAASFATESGYHLELVPWGARCDSPKRSELIHAEDSLQQDIGAIGAVGPASKFSWRVADAAHTRNKDHAHGTKLGHDLSVVTCPTGQAHGFQAQTGGSLFDAGLNLRSGHGSRVVFKFLDRDLSAGLAGDLLSFLSYLIPQPGDLLG